MAHLSGPELAAWYVGILLSFAALVRIALLGVAGSYRAVVFFLAVSVARSILLASLPFNSNAYGAAYLCTLPILHGAQVWLVVEIYNHVFESYRGIAALGRWTILGALVAGAALAVATTLIDHDPTREPFPILGLMHQLQAIVTKALLAFLLLICAVLSWFPIPQRRNVLLIGFGTTAFFTAVAAALVVRGLNPTAWTRMASASSLYVYAAVTGMWLIGFASKKADVVAAPALAVTGEMEQALAGRLGSLNRALESLRKAS